MTDEEMEHFIKELQPTIRTFAKAYFKGGEQVEDAVQEHALYLWAKRRDIDLLLNARAYAIGMAHILFRTVRRRQEAELRVVADTGGADHDDPDDDGKAPPALQVPSGSERDALRDLEVRRALASLPERQRQAVWLVLGEGYSSTAAGFRLGVVRMTVERWVIAARKALQSKLHGWRVLLW